MTDDVFPRWVQATPEYVFTTIISHFKLQYQCELNPGTFTMDTPLHRFELANDGPGDWPAPSWFNLWGDIATKEAWKQAYKSCKTLGDLCVFIAPRTRRPTIRTINMLGQPCKPAAAFLTIKTMLRHAGADVSDLSPSSNLRPWLKRHLQTFAVDCFRIAPDLLSNLRVDHPPFRTASRGYAVAVLAVLLGCCLNSCFSLRNCAGLVIVLSIPISLWLCHATSKMPPQSVKLGSMRTFRDLCVQMADQSSAV